ncbi:hypothetical protein [Streptomyces sp. Tue6028]|uniref:hypothetical protein n=1 Tax=Streptomyces sp. Tue6028 TaxID=2036037 RepID=UPI003D72B825
MNRHSEKEQAAATYRRGFDYHPLPASWTTPAGPWPVGPGNADASTATEHITILDQALAQIPDAHSK